MNKFTNGFLLFFCTFVQSGEGLVIPTSTVGSSYLQAIYKIDNKNYKQGSLLFELKKNGGYCCSFASQDKTVLMTDTNIDSSSNPEVINTFYQLRGCKPIIPKNCKMYPEMTVGVEKFSVKHWPFPTNFWDRFFLRQKACQTAQCINVSNSQNDSLFCFELPSLINEFYCNDENYSYYYLDNAAYINYIDLLPSSNKYKHLFMPIFNIKNARSSDVITIWNNVFVFLKNYFYDAFGNKRLKNSLREVFFNNAGIVFSHLIPLYYAAVLFLICQRNSNLMKFAQLVVLAHLCCRFRLR